MQFLAVSCELRIACAICNCLLQVANFDLGSQNNQLNLNSSNF